MMRTTLMIHPKVYKWVKVSLVVLVEVRDQGRVRVLGPQDPEELPVVVVPTREKVVAGLLVLPG